jgi:hypothetical protein
MANDHFLTLRFGGRKTLSRRTTDFDLRHFENSQKMKPNFDSAKDFPGSSSSHAVFGSAAVLTSRKNFCRDPLTHAVVFSGMPNLYIANFSKPMTEPHSSSHQCKKLDLTLCTDPAARDHA